MAKTWEKKEEKSLFLFLYGFVLFFFLVVQEAKNRFVLAIICIFVYISNFHLREEFTYFG